MSEWIRWVYWGMVLFNGVAFAAMGIDKRRAVHSRGRLRERLLLGFALLGGAPGILCGMVIFHHKTQKSRFRLGVPALALVHAVLIGLMLFQADLHILLKS